MVYFEFVSDKDAHALLEIYNLTGQRVKTLMDKPVQEGVLNKIEYRPNDQVEGVLLYKLFLDDAVQTGRIVYNRK